MTDSGWFWSGLTFGTLAVWVVLLVIFPNWIISLILAGLVVSFSILMVYQEWAPCHILFGLNPEGQVKTITRGGEVYSFVMRQEGHVLSLANIPGREIDGKAVKKWDVIPIEYATKEEKRISWLQKHLGGLFLIGPPPIYQIDIYDHKWTHLHEDGTAHHHEERLDYQLLKTDLYVIDIPLIGKGGEEEGVEDKDGVPLGVKIALPMKVVNPYESLYRTSRWLPMITGLIQAQIRRFFPHYHYKEELLPMISKEGEDLWKVFWDEIREDLEGKMTSFAITSTTLRVCGVEIDLAGCGLLSLDLPSWYRKTSTRQYTAREDGEARKIEAAAVGLAVSREVTVPVLAIAKQLAGISKSDQDLDETDWRRVELYITGAWSNYLEQQSIRAIKPTDKIIVTSGEGVGRLVGRDAVREAIRQEIGQKKASQKEEEKEEEKEKEEE